MPGVIADLRDGPKEKVPEVRNAYRFLRGAHNSVQGIVNASQALAEQHLDSIGVPPSTSAAWLGHTLAVFLDTYFPERGAMGVEQAAEAMERAIAV